MTVLSTSFFSVSFFLRDGIFAVVNDEEPTYYYSLFVGRVDSSYFPALNNIAINISVQDFFPPSAFLSMGLKPRLELVCLLVSVSTLVCFDGSLGLCRSDPTFFFLDKFILCRRVWALAFY